MKNICITLYNYIILTYISDYNPGYFFNSIPKASERDTNSGIEILK